MAHIEGPAYTGPLTIDITNHKGDLVDLAPNALKGARAEQPGLADVLTELAHAIPKYGDDAEIHSSIHGRIVAATSTIEALREKESALVKMLEIVRESRGRLENNREDDISAIAAQAEDKANRGKKPELLAHFEKTIAYRSQIAAKAADTRRKNEEAKAAQSPSADGQTNG